MCVEECRQAPLGEHRLRRQQGAELFEDEELGVEARRQLEGAAEHR
jgi:hypothetical protein